MAAPAFKSPKDFKWERVSHLEQVGVKMRQKDGPKKSYNKRFVALMYNYLVYFKEPKGDKPGPKDLGAGLLELERCSGEEAVQMVNGDKGGDYVFSVQTQDKMHYFVCSDMSSLQSWIGSVKNNIRKLRQYPRDNADLLHSKLRKAEESLRSERLKVPESVEPKEGEAWAKNIASLKAMYFEFAPVVTQASLYFEYQYENATSRYLKWFVDEVNGPLARIEASETSVLAKWKEKIEEGPLDMVEATKRFFFFEDIKPYAAVGRQFKMLVSNYQLAMQTLKGDMTPYYSDLIQTVEQVMQVIEATPAAADVKFDAYKDGSLTNVNQTKKWRYFKYDGILKTEVMGAEIPEPVNWEIKGPHVYMHPTLYGTIMWNNRTWVWTHANFSFLIRYEYDEASGIFQQNLQATPKDMTTGPILVDWQLQGNMLRAVTVGQKPTQPHVPEDISWSFEQGPLPPSLMLLVASMYIIKPIVRGEIKIE